MVRFAVLQNQQSPGARQHGGAAGFRARGFQLIAITFVALLLVSLAASWAAIEVVNSLRAYAVGEGRYSKSQKTAVIDLNRFVYSGDRQDYEAFLAAIAVPQGDRDARVALQSRPVDRAAARAGFLQGNNNPKDVDSLIVLFRRYAWWGPFKAAIGDWAEGDRLVALLVDEGVRVAQANAAGTLTADTRAEELATIGRLDDGLTELENNFSTHMGDAARMAGLVIAGLGGTTLLLWMIGTAYATHLFRRQLSLDRQLALSEQRFRDYAEVASDWHWEVDSEFRFTYMSERFFETTGAAPEFVLGQSAAEFMRENRIEAENDQHLGDLTARLPVRGLRLRHRRSDGTMRYFWLSAKPHVDDAGVFLGYRGVGTDVTSTVEDAMMLRQAKERADLANRAKSEFLANMSHELRTPLNAIIGFSEVILEKVFGAYGHPRYESYVGDIHNSGRHLLSIINDILDLSKIEAGQEDLSIDEVILDEIIASTQKLFRGRFEQAGLRLTVDLPSPPLALEVDARKLKQCLANLLSNALKFTPAGGSVTVSASVGAEGAVSIAVRDTGIGIDSKQIPTVLTAFGQVASPFQRAHSGTGLGLPITRALIELHGGTLTLDSTLGGGTTVTLTIPRSRLVARSGQEDAGRGSARGLG